MAGFYSFDRAVLGEWARSRIPYVRSWGEWYQAIGHIIDGKICAAVIFNNYDECNISMHVAAEPGTAWATRGFLETVFAYPFGQLALRRVTGYVLSGMEAEQKFDEALGFRREGLMRDAAPHDDVVIMGMLAGECKYYGKIQQPAAAT